MERLTCLSRYQQGVLIVLILMVLVFSVIYPTVIAQEGFAYKDALLIPTVENGKITYEGEIRGNPAAFIVYADKTVEFQYGDKLYGPYTAKEDATAIPKDSEMRDLMTGIEMRCGEEIIFRGAVLNHGDVRRLYNEDGSMAIFFSVESGNGTTLDENGNPIDSMEPSVSTILNLMAGPELTHKGQWLPWFLGVLICIATAISILFADELFRFRLSFRVDDAYGVEPSDWEIASRYLSWTLMPILALVIFVMGLR